MKRLRKTVSAWCLRGLQSVAWHPGPTLLLALWAYWRYPMALLCVVGAWTAAAAGFDARALKLSASSLACAVKLAYRRCYLRIFWDRRICKSACVEEMRKVPHGNTTTVELHHPKLLHRHFWSLHHWRYRIRRTPTGIVFFVDGTPVGRNPEGFEGAPAASISSSMKAKDVTVVPHPTFEHITMFYLTYLAPFVAPVDHTEIPVCAQSGTVYVGKDERRALVSLNMLMHHLFVGASRSGKSSKVWMALKGLLDQGLPFLVWTMDPKGGVEFFNLEGKAFVYEDNVLKCTTFIENALKYLKIRQDEMKAAGERKWKPGDNRWPLVVIVIDELITFRGFLKKQKIKISGQEVAAEEALAFLLTQGLGIGFMCIACSQAGQKELIGVVRDLFSTITCFRVPSDEMVRAVGLNPKIHRAHKIPFGDQFAGQAYMVTEEGPIVHYRAGWCPDEERDRIAEGIGVWSQKYWAEKVKIAAVTELALDLKTEDTEGIAA